MRFLVFIFLLPTVASSQNFINKSQKEIKKEWGKSMGDLCKPAFQKTDSTFIVTACTTSTYGKSARYIYSFDKKGNCNAERTITHCDSCLARILDQLLALKQYNWKKINENQYVSDFTSRLLIELPAENKDHSMLVMRMEWSEELYKLLMKN